MSNTLRDFYKDQYTDFASKLLASWGITEEQLAALSEEVKPLHKKYLSLACIASVAAHRKKRNEYVSSIVDVCQLAIILAIKGTENSANVLLRQSIELTLKHIYFLTHSTEYKWTQNRDDYREHGFQSLLEYLQMTDEIRNLDSKELLIDPLTHHFALMSRYVHAHSGKYQRFFAFSESKSSDLLKKLNQVSCSLWPALICILIIFSNTEYNRASDLEKRLIRSGLPQKQKSFIDAHLKSTG